MPPGEGTLKFFARLSFKKAGINEEITMTTENQRRIDRCAVELEEARDWLLVLQKEYDHARANGENLTELSADIARTQERVEDAEYTYNALVKLEFGD